MPCCDRLSTAVLQLPDAMEEVLVAGHPWVYRERMPPAFRAESGATVRVRAGRFSGYGIYSRGGQIALRILSCHEPPDAAWVAARIRDARDLRAPFIAADTTAYRLVFGEGDLLPGVTVDVYGSFGVVATYADGLDALARWAAEAATLELGLAGVLWRRRAESEGARGTTLLLGRQPPGEVVVSEHGARFAVDLVRSQKTGLFLDHRENRRRVAMLCAGKSVLNLFAYTGGFSVHAALAGARHVTSVDVAQPVMTAAMRNFELNGLDSAAHEFVTEDAFAWLDSARRRGLRYDVVICDPPSFAKRREQRRDALKAYKRLNSAVLRVVSAGGYLATASCTSQVEPEAFRRVVAEAAMRARRRLQLVLEAGAGPDHPTLVVHPEGRYLKFLLGRVT